MLNFVRNQSQSSTDKIEPPPGLALSLITNQKDKQFLVDILERKQATSIFNVDEREQDARRNQDDQLLPTLRTSQSVPNQLNQNSKEFKQLSLQRRTQMLEEQRWRHNKNNVTGDGDGDGNLDPASSSNKKTQTKNKKYKKTKDWRTDRSLSIEDTPSMMHGLSRVTIDKKWTMQYNIEQNNFSSTALQYEIRLREVFAATEGMGVPNIQRTAVAAELLWKLSAKFGRFSELHGLLVYELLQGCYHRFDDAVSSASSASSASSSSTASSASPPTQEHTSKQTDRTDSFHMSHFLSMTPFYEHVDGLQASVRKLRQSLRKLKALRDEVETEANKRNQVFSMAILAWQGQLTRRTFQNWRAGVCLIKRTRTRLKARRLRIWFDAFKKRWRESSRLNILQQYNETEVERQRQEDRADGLLADKTQLEREAVLLNKNIDSLKTHIMERDATVEDLKRQLLESKDREQRLTDSCNQLVTLQLNHIKDTIGEIPGLEKTAANGGSGDNSDEENTFVESKSGTTTKVKNDPFWNSLKDMSQLSISALEQLEIEASGSEGTVQRMNYDNMKLWEAGELALGKSL
jgi:hypothetical protein